VEYGHGLRLGTSTERKADQQDSHYELRKDDKVRH
jgi:hypothetical protein